jgi:3-oxoacyl-[acyl-carrier protein] reductase
MELGIAGKTALLLSSTAGLGFGCARALANEGVNVVINGRDPGRGRDALEKLGSNAHFVQGDITREEDRIRILEETRKRFGDVSILVTNADGPKPGSFLSKNSSEWIEAYKLIMESTIDMVRMVISDMIRNKYGRIVNISSTSAKETIPGSVFANSFKPALLGALNTLAREMADSGITINSILPGPFDTERIRKYAEELYSDLNPEEAFIEYQKILPMKKIGEIEEFGALCAFLCSEKARYITSQSIVIDGGQIVSFL